MPIGAMGTAGRQVFHLLRRLKEELKVNLLVVRRTLVLVCLTVMTECCIFNYGYF